jgi:hypothetical protein
VYSDVSQIRAEALAIDPVRVLLAVLAFPFVVLGVLLRVVWLVPAFCIAAGRVGWRRADEVVRAHEARARAG